MPVTSDDLHCYSKRPEHLQLYLKVNHMHHAQDIRLDIFSISTTKLEPVASNQHERAEGHKNPNPQRQVMLLFFWVFIRGGRNERNVHQFNFCFPSKPAARTCAFIEI